MLGKLRFLLLTTYDWKKAQRIILLVYIDVTWKDNTKKQSCKTLSCCTTEPLKT